MEDPLRSIQTKYVCKAKAKKRHRAYKSIDDVKIVLDQDKNKSMRYQQFSNLFINNPEVAKLDRKVSNHEAEVNINPISISRILNENEVSSPPSPTLRNGSTAFVNTLRQSSAE